MERSAIEYSDPMVNTGRELKGGVPEYKKRLTPRSLSTWQSHFEFPFFQDELQNNRFFHRGIVIYQSLFSFPPDCTAGWPTWFDVQWGPGFATNGWYSFLFLLDNGIKIATQTANPLPDGSFNSILTF
jgi:hypothetical protein